MLDIANITVLEPDSDEDRNITHIIFPVQREWLNPEDSYDTGHFKLNGSYDSRICNYGKSKGKQVRSIDMHLTLADCNRTIELNFSCDDDDTSINYDGVGERLNKVRKLLKALTTIEDRLLEFAAGADVTK